MAMSMRSRGGLAASTNRNRIGIRPVYDDFKPRVELKEDPEAHIVYIHLPGFLKEQIKIVAESSRGLLRVRGERLVSANTWSRFLEEVVVPENCDVTKTHAKFEGGVLRITMPKRISVVVSQSLPTSDEASTPERSPPQPPRPSPQPHPTSLHPITSPQTAPRLVPPPSQPPPHTRPNVLPQPQTTTTTPRVNALPPQQTHMTGLVAPEANLPPKMSEPRFTPSIQPKPREDAKLKQTPIPRPTLLPPPPHPELGSFTPSINMKPLEDNKPKFEANQKTSQQPVPTTKSSPKGLQQALQYPNSAPRKDPTDYGRWISEPTIPTPLEDLVTRGAPKYEATQKPLVPPVPTNKSSLERLKEVLPHQDLAPQKDPIASERWRSESNTPMPPQKSITRDSPMMVPTENEKHKKAIQGMSIRRLNDDRQLLVNMGVAVMVIVALGAWISYSFGSFEKSDN